MYVHDLGGCLSCTIYVARCALFFWLIQLSSIRLTADTLPGTCSPWGALITLALLVLAVSIGLIPLLMSNTQNCKLYKCIHVRSESSCEILLHKTSAMHFIYEQCASYSLSHTGNAMYGTYSNAFHVQKMKNKGHNKNLHILKPSAMLSPCIIYTISMDSMTMTMTGLT